jgi:nucleolar complex protein 3
MIKERHYRVHPNVLACLLHLRLRSELGQMREKGKGKGKGKDSAFQEVKAKSETRKKWMTKNKKKAEKERKEVEKEMEEAEAEVDTEERATVVSAPAGSTNIERSRLSIHCGLSLPANRDPQKPFRPLLLHYQATETLSTPSRCPRGYQQIRAPREHRILP